MRLLALASLIVPLLSWAGERKILMIIASQNFRDEELKVPKDFFERKGAKVVVASSSLKEAKGMLGMKVKPDVTLKEVSVKDFDAIVFVGGTGAAEYWESEIAHKISREAYKQGKVVAAICIAPVTLAKAGLLKGRKATVFPTEASKIEKEGAKYTGSGVEVDGKIVTASAPKHAGKFAEEIWKLLK